MRFIDLNLGSLRRRMGWTRRLSLTPNKTLAAARCLEQFRAVVAHVTWRHAKASFKRTIEIGQITKARVICDRADWILRQSRLGQHAVGATETLQQQEFRERCAFAFKEPLQIARRESAMGWHRADRQP